MDENDRQWRHYPVVEAVIDAFANWLNHRREIADSCCENDEFRHIAHDLGVTPGDLHALVEAGPHSVDELPKMMAALNLSAEDIRKAQPRVMRDLERVCGLCKHKHRCTSELAHGTAAGNYHQYCNNTLTLAKLVEERETAH